MYVTKTHQKNQVQSALEAGQCCCCSLKIGIVIGITINAVIAITLMYLHLLKIDEKFFVSEKGFLWIITGISLILSIGGMYGLYTGKRKHLEIFLFAIEIYSFIIGIWYLCGYREWWNILHDIKELTHHIGPWITTIDFVNRIFLILAIQKALKVMNLVKDSLIIQSQLKV